MNFEKRLAEAKEESRLMGISIPEDKWIKSTIVEMNLNKNTKELWQVTLKCRIAEGEAEGKRFQKSFVIDEKTNNPQQSKIALIELVKILEIYGKAEFKDEKELALICMDMADKEIYVHKTVTKSKNGEEYPNYKFAKEPK